MAACRVEGCNRVSHTKGYCSKHYQQIRRRGKILNRSLKDGNEFVFDDDVCKIKLYDIWGNIKAKTIIDKEDYEKVKDYTWCLNDNGYVKSRNGNYTFSLAPFLLGTLRNKSTIVDHIDGDTLNNCKNNLRVCSCQQNTANQKGKNCYSSKYKGVCWAKGIKKWRSRIKYNYSTISIPISSASSS